MWGDEGCADAEAGALEVNAEAAAQKGRNRVGGVFDKCRQHGGQADTGHGQRGVGDDHVVTVGDDPSRRGVGSTALAGESAEPLVERLVSAVEAAAVMPASGREAPGGGAQSIQRNFRGRPNAHAAAHSRAGWDNDSGKGRGRLGRKSDGLTLSEELLGLLRGGLEDER